MVLLFRTVHYPIFVKGLLGIISIYHNVTSKVTKLSFGKKEEIRGGKKLQDTSLWPIILLIEVEGITLKAEVTCINGKEFQLTVNGTPYLQLKYKAIVMSADDCKIAGMSGRIKLNDH